MGALELGDPLQVVALVDTCRLEQFVEAVQHDHRERASARVHEVRPRHVLVERGPDAVFDLRENVGVRRHAAQLDPEREELARREAGGKHAGQYGLARTRLPQHEQRRLGGQRLRQVGGQEGREVVAVIDLRPYLLGGHERDVRMQTIFRVDVALFEQGESHSRGVCGWRTSSGGVVRPDSM
ncbi:hypothetical protein GCM10020001_014580 [Nonomuraea salmonea]